MATSVEAVSALNRGIADWNDYRAQQASTIDLTLADLRGADLQGRDLSGCNLSGADMDDADLDGARFVGANLNNASLANASLVGCQFQKVTLNGAILRNCVLRESVFSDVAAHQMDLRSARVEACTFEACTLSAARVDGLVMHASSFTDSEVIDLDSNGMLLDGVRFVHVKISNNSWKAAQLTDCRFDSSSVQGLTLVDSAQSRCSFIGTEIRGLVLQNCVVHDLDFSGSNLKEVELAPLHLPTVIVQGATLIDCGWPRQAPTVGWFGKYKSSPDLLGHPVQDVDGLRPRLRREIADAQYLDELYGSNRGYLHRTGLRLWGASTLHGQSLIRLSCWTLCILLLMVAVLPLLDGHISAWPDNLRAIPQSCATVLANFLGLSGPERGEDTTLQRLWIVGDRIFGFFVLGLWIGIAANKLGRLSAD